MIKTNCFNCKHREVFNPKLPCKALVKSVLEFVNLPIKESSLKKIGISCCLFEEREELIPEKVKFT